MAKIGLKEAIQAAYDELYAAITEIPVRHGLNFEYQAIDMEFTVEMAESKERSGGVKVWVVEGAAKGATEERTTHTIRLSIAPRGPGWEGSDFADIVVTDEITSRGSRPGPGSTRRGAGSQGEPGSL
ncbi:hypothetical protein SO3561_07358 [Streptomyces olivochromogenes]|uniref:Trypsin-co-occurring domain-containing protein n=1 Tax=Streptomyces olivochromogenes TaxID=1963 RepID=A0A250VNZ0_STROL|nr:hypothetical protein SO3561_07358 [Streptomyces olivochromogenes]